MEMKDLNPDGNVKVGKTAIFVDVIGKLDISFGDGMSALADAISQGLLTPDPKKVVSEEEKQERQEKEDAKKELRNKLYQWLVNNDGPSYNGDRKNARTISEILASAGIHHIHTMTAKNILESESTGWGLVDIVQGQRLYGKKAALIAFRKVEQQQEAAD